MMASAHGYPRPQLERAAWTNLNGEWEFAIDRQARWSQPDQVEWNATIMVPFAPETEASGIADQSFYQACWYRRTITLPEAAGDRVLLHFGAVDYRATVWVDGQLAATHQGGYTPFTVDLSGARSGGDVTIVVRAEDDPHDLAKPRGKQDWLPEPHAIWYPRTTGIWQTVWLEQVPSTSIGRLRWTPSVTRWQIDLDARIDGAPRDDLRLYVTLSVGDTVLADDSYALSGGEIQRAIGLWDPGIDDIREELMWTPAHPTLITAQLELRDAAGATIDRVRSYTALRQVDRAGGRFMLNGRPMYLRLVLDQGYWLPSGLTAPDDDALRRDVELVKQMGFNGVRKHQKIEDPRFLYWADTLGIFVWEEMPSAYRFSRDAVQQLTREWSAAIERDYSHPCIIAWVPFNESWGVPELPSSTEQQNYVHALYYLTRTLDPTRPVIGNDGWELSITDILAIHDYDSQPERVAARYRSPEVLESLLSHDRPGSRVLLLDGFTYQGQPVMLTEFGGIAYSDDPEHTWGYSRSGDAETLAASYTALLEAVRGSTLLSGFCYTQFTDTYQESNGLLYMDRTPKFPLDRMMQATSGRTPEQMRMEQARGEHRMERRSYQARRLRTGRQ